MTTPPYIDGMAALDRRWAEAVCSVCDPVCESAQVGFTHQILKDEGHGVTALLWEADPLLFAERYPDSGVVGSYGPEWPPPCIDFWVHVDAENHEARFEVEGPRIDDDVVALAGDGLQDGRSIARVLARILGVRGPGA
jgi:hypothetical protein